jgi:hypothetical protein
VKDLSQWRAWVRPAKWLVQQGPRARTESGRSLLAQAKDLYLLDKRYRINPKSYYFWRLHLPDRLSRVQDWITQPRAEDVFMRSDPTQAATLNNKMSFWQFCSDRGLSTIPVLARFEDGNVWIETKIDEIDAWALLAKPMAGGRGHGILRWVREADGYRDDEGNVFSTAELIEYLTQRSKDVSYILQPCELNHPTIEPVSGGALSPIRVITVLDDDKVPRSVLAFLVVTQGQTYVANLTRSDAMGVPVDLQSGSLGAAFSKAMKPGQSRLLVHPVGGAAFKGIQLPFWQETLHLAEKAHAELPGMLVVGWDMANTPRGPTIIEGNARPGFENPQTVHDQSMRSLLDESGITCRVLNEA